MTLHEYKIEHFGKVLYREPTSDDWHWNSEDYGSQYYAGTDKPTMAHILGPNLSDSLDDLLFPSLTDYYKIDIKHFKNNNKKEYSSYYLTPAPFKPLWVSENLNWKNIREGKYKKLVLLELERKTIYNIRFPSVGTIYVKCLITTPDNRTHLEWLLQKWIMPLPTINSVKELKEKLLKEFKQEKNLK
jgi:hypothetical protein